MWLSSYRSDVMKPFCVLLGATVANHRAHLQQYRLSYKLFPSHAALYTYSSMCPIYYLQDSAHIYVCGDAKSMAGDVHNTLLEVFTDNGLGTHEAEEYMDKLEKALRYQRDVWVT